MRYRYAIIYESDTQPVETVRGEFVSRDTPSACLQGGREARDHWPTKRRFRSVVMIIEALDDAGNLLSDDEVAVTEAADV